MRSVWAGALVVVGLGSAGSHWLGQRQAAGDDRVARSKQARMLDRLGQLEQRVLELEHAHAVDARLLQAALARAANERTEESKAALNEPAAPDTDDEADEVAEAPAVKSARQQLDPSPEAVRARAEGLLAKYDQDSLAPPVDPTWVNPTLRAAEASISSAIPGARVLEERCGGNTCRLVIEHAAGDDIPAQNRGLLEMPPFDQGSTLSPLPTSARDPARSRVYIHRPAA